MSEQVRLNAKQRKALLLLLDELGAWAEHLRELVSSRDLDELMRGLAIMGRVAYDARGQVLAVVLTDQKKRKVAGDKIAVERIKRQKRANAKRSPSRSRPRSRTRS